MKKTARLLTAALAGIGATSAHAVVEMYGTVMPFFENAKTSGATFGAPADRPNMVPASAYTGVNDPARNRITAGTSAWGFRGDEDLAPGLKLVWQLESGFQVDQNTGPGLGARNSKIGLQCSSGELFVGQWDTPYKFISLAINPLRAGYVFDYTVVMGNPGQGVPATTTQATRIGAKPDAAFDKRAGNSVQYWSPRWAGLSLRVGHSFNEGKGAVVAGGPVISPEIWSTAILYDVGGLSLRFAWERHTDYFGLSQLGGSAAGTLANRTSHDSAYKGIAIWRIGNTRLAAAFEKLRYKNSDSTAGAVNQYMRDSQYFLVEQRFGANTPHSVWVAYGRASNGSCERVGGLACSTTAMGTNYLTLGYMYRFSRRTEFFATYYKVNNDTSGTYATQPLVGVSLPPGADTTGVGAGLLHFF